MNEIIPSSDDSGVSIQTIDFGMGILFSIMIAIAFIFWLNRHFILWQKRRINLPHSTSKVDNSDIRYMRLKPKGRK